MTPLKLMVVDDEPDFAAFVVDVAEGMDFQTLSTTDPSKFASLYTIDIDIIVLDLFMPGIDGVELLRFLSDNKSKASVVFMSGKDMGVLRSVQELASEQGINVLGTLQKPFRVEALEEVLAKYIQRSPARIAGTAELPSLNELREAILHEDLYLVYQPQVNISDRKVVGVEALIRWVHPVKGMIPPDFFIPFAEENGLISDITSFVNRTATQQLKAWNDCGLNIRMSINTSPKDLDNLDIPEKLYDSAAALGIDTFNIVIEVTETTLMSNLTRYMDILARLRMKGFILSIDDFGTGHSSLQQLVRVPFTELKIDQAFIRKLDTDKECLTITEISILLAHKLGMTVIAEGIETETVWNILRELGCDEGQGYWMGKPMRAEEIEPWIAEWTSV